MEKIAMFRNILNILGSNYLEAHKHQNELEIVHLCILQALQELMADEIRFSDNNDIYSLGKGRISKLCRDICYHFNSIW